MQAYQDSSWYDTRIEVLCVDLIMEQHQADICDVQFSLISMNSTRAALPSSFSHTGLCEKEAFKESAGSDVQAECLNPMPACNM